MEDTLPKFVPNPWEVLVFRSARFFAIRCALHLLQSFSRLVFVCMYSSPHLQIILTFSVGILFTPQLHQSGDQFEGRSA